MKSEARLTPVFSKILYAQAWEDPRVDLEAFSFLSWRLERRFRAAAA